MVKVPVLSNTTVSMAAKRSNASADLINTPARNKWPTAATCTAGTASPKAQGQVITNTAKAVIKALCQSAPPSIQPTQVSAAKP